MKRKAVLLVTVFMLLLSSCAEGEKEINSEQASSDQSLVENTSSSESVEEKKEIWTETEEKDNQSITIEYTDFGESWTKTIISYDENKKLAEKQEYVIKNRDVIKTTTWTYDDSGNVVLCVSEENHENGDKTVTTDYIEPDKNLRSVSSLLHKKGDSYAYSGIEEIKDLKTEKIYAKIEHSRESIDGSDYMVIDTTRYKNGQPHHHYISYSNLDDSSKYISAIKSIDGNMICEQFVSYSIDAKQDMTEVFYRDAGKGYIKTERIGNVLKYYNSPNGIDCEVVYTVEISPETNQTVNAFFDTEKYTATEVQRIIDEARELANKINEFQNEADIYEIG